MVNYGTGEYLEAVEAPLANAQTVDDIHAHAWPKIEHFDFADLRRQFAEDDNYRIRRAGSFEPFLLYCRLRGMEQSYEDLLVNPEIAEAIFEHLFDLHYELNRRIYDIGNGKVDLTYVAEDLAGQTAPLFSLDTYRKFLLPRQKKMADLARSHGIHVFYHTDGAASCFLPDLIDVVGIEVLNPLQWRCPGMELAGLAKNFGDRIAFHGGIDNQQTLPFGTPEDVIEEVKNAAAIFKDRRWICAPCHNIQAVTPTANVIAMYQAIRAVGRK
jgi:uroporphyrinogen decarboxylase